MKDKITFKEDYWDSGKLRYKHQFLNDKLHGEQLGYYPNGKLYYKYYYINGVEVTQEEWNRFNGVNSPHFNLLNRTYEV